MGFFFPKIVNSNHRHHFAALTFDGIPMMGRWKCKGCGMKVSNRATAEALEGKRI